jgi:ABC-2 type transport system permease protein
MGLGTALAFAYALILGAVMIYCFWLALTTAAFWIVRMDEIHELWDGIYQSGRWPVTIYPGWLQVSLTYLVPIAFAVTVPAEVLTGRLTLETLVLATALAVALVLVSRWWWRFGLKHYSGASA